MGDPSGGGAEDLFVRGTDDPPVGDGGIEDAFSDGKTGTDGNSVGPLDKDPSCRWRRYQWRSFGHIRTLIYSRFNR